MVESMKQAVNQVVSQRRTICLIPRKIREIPTGLILATMLIICRLCSKPVISVGVTMLQLVYGTLRVWYSHCILHPMMYISRGSLFRMSNQAIWLMFPGSRHQDTTGAIIL